MSGEEWSIREFRALHATINQGSITAAAARLGVSQPAISRTLAQLEAKIGRKLLQRSGRSVVPTADAIRINEKLMPFFTVLDDLRAARDEGVRGEHLRLAVPPAFAAGYIQRVIASFLAQHPDVTVELEVRSSPIIVSDVADGLIELGISDMETETSNVRRLPIHSSRMACFLPAAHPLAGQPEIALQALAGERLIALSRRHYARQQLDRMLATLALTDKIRIETSTTIAALGFVRQGLGAALMNPFPIAHDLPDDVRAVPVRPDISYTASFIVAPHARVKRVNAFFMQHLKRSLPRTAG